MCVCKNTDVNDGALSSFPSFIIGLNIGCLIKSSTNGSILDKVAL
jgi:hypothetical protein